MSLDERKYRILRAIIDDYILTAMPVGSRTLSRKSEIGLSSATIRNEMSDLEEMGYLDQPHTSAGRVPSVRAFRLYVDQLMRVAALGREERDYIRSHIGRATVVLQDVLENTARVLGEVTDYAAAVMLPQSKSVRIEHIQLVPITQGLALMVLVTNAGVFKDTLIRVPSGKGVNTRIELRSPDAAANPYLALAVLLEAGMDGIRNQIMPPDCIDEDIQKMTPQRRAELEIQELPRSLIEAVEELEKDELVLDVLGRGLADKIIKAHKKEYHDYCMQVTDWEISNYLYKL